VQFCSTIFNVTQPDKKAINFVKVLGGISLVAAPLLTLIGWSIAHKSVSSFLNFDFSFAPSDATAQLTASSHPSLLFRYYLLPHYFIYSSMPVYIGLALTLMHASYKKSPWHSFIGAICSIIGAVYFIGVLGAFLSIPMGTVIMTNILKVSFGLMMLLFIGNIIIGFSLFKSTILPKWGIWLFIAGNLLILVFPGIENWMALGSFLMMAGLLPLSKKIIVYHLY
jgi:hypothetical protein